MTSFVTYPDNITKVFFYLNDERYVKFLEQDIVKWRFKTCTGWIFGECNVNLITKSLPNGVTGYGYMIDLNMVKNSNKLEKDEWSPNSDVFLFTGVNKKIFNTIKLNMITSALETLTGASYSCDIDPFGVYYGKLENLSWDCEEKIAYVEMSSNLEQLIKNLNLWKAEETK